MLEEVSNKGKKEKENKQADECRSLMQRVELNAWSGRSRPGREDGT